MSVGGSKWNWLLEHLVEFTSAGSVLIFVTKKANCEELAHNLQTKEFEVRLLHGDLNQVQFTVRSLLSLQKTIMIQTPSGVSLTGIPDNETSKSVLS